MTTITFKLKDETPAGEIGTALKEICSLQDLFNVKAVFPADAEKGRKLYFTADVAAGAEVPAVVEAVRAAPYVEYAQVPPDRIWFRHFRKS